MDDKESMLQILDTDDIYKVKLAGSFNKRHHTYIFLLEYSYDTGKREIKI